MRPQALRDVDFGTRGPLNTHHASRPHQGCVWKGAALEIRTHSGDYVTVVVIAVADMPQLCTVC